jgi:hypothetical protein
MLDKDLITQIDPIKLCFSHFNETNVRVKPTQNGGLFISNNAYGLFTLKDIGHLEFSLFSSFYINFLDVKSDIKIPFSIVLD